MHHGERADARAQRGDGPAADQDLTADLGEDAEQQGHPATLGTQDRLPRGLSTGRADQAEAAGAVDEELLEESEEPEVEEAAGADDVVEVVEEPVELEEERLSLR